MPRNAPQTKKDYQNPNNSACSCARNCRIEGLHLGIFSITLGHPKQLLSVLNHVRAFVVELFAILRTALLVGLNEALRAEGRPFSSEGRILFIAGQPVATQLPRPI